jgi:hypothetical protein
MAKKLDTKKKVIPKKAVDSKTPKKLSLSGSVQHIRLYPKYNPLRDK